MGWFRKKPYVSPGIQITGTFDSGWALDYHSTKQHGEWRRTTVGERVYRLKYRGHKASGRWLAKTCVEFLNNLNPIWTVDLILAIPPSRPRWKHTAAEYVAGKVAKVLRIPYQHRAIAKRRATRFVKEAISKEQKQQIIQDTMSVSHPETIEGKRILLMDDLIKSGITSDEAIRALREANPAWIGFLVWSIAGKRIHHLD